MATFGLTSIAAAAAVAFDYNSMRGSGTFNLPSQGTITGMSVYLDGNGGGVGSSPFILAIYTDAAGTPGTLVAQTLAVTVTSGQAAGWVNATFASNPTLPAGNYWLFHAAGGSSDPATMRVWRTSSGGTNSYTFIGITYPTLPATYNGSAGSGPDLIAVYATYTPVTVSSNRFTRWTPPFSAATRF